MAYATVAELKAYLGIAGPSDDALLLALLTRSRAIFEAEPPLGTGRIFEADSDATRYFDSRKDTEGRELWLDEDLCAITTVTNGDEVEVTATEYVTEPVNDTPYYIIKILGSSSKAWVPKANGDTEKAISIVGKWAYSTAPPEDIVHGTIRLAAFLYRQKESSADFPGNVFSPDGAVMLPARLPSDVEAIIKRYREKVVVR